MGNKRRARQTAYEEPVGDRGRSDRWEEKRRRFAKEERRGSKGLRPTFYITLGGILLAVLFVVFMTFRADGTDTASASVLQQAPASTASTEGSRVGISVQEVREKKLVYWDYKDGNKTTPLIAYLAPSGAVKVAIRMCEPCNGYAFRVEGNQIVCNTCGTRWDLESSKGLSGGCQAYPPEVLPSTIADGKITVDEAKVSEWKPRV